MESLTQRLIKQQQQKRFLEHFTEETGIFVDRKAEIFQWKGKEIVCTR